VTGLLNAPDKGFEIRTSAVGATAKDFAEAGAKDKAAEGDQLIRKAQAREIELKAEADAVVRKAEAEVIRANAEHRFAEAMLVEAQAELVWTQVEKARAEIAQMKQGLGVRQQVVDAALAGGKGAHTSVTVKDELVDVTVEHGNAVPKAGKVEAG